MQLMRQIVLDESTQDLLSLIEAALAGKEIIITKDDKPVVKLIPIPIENKSLHSKAGVAKVLVTTSDRFDRAIADFEDCLP